MAQLKNYMEDIISMYIDKILSDMNVCDCEACKLDISAIALNNLPAKYVVTYKGETYTKLNLLIQQFEVDVITEITKAAKIVSKTPRH